MFTKIWRVRNGKQLNHAYLRLLKTVTLNVLHLEKIIFWNNSMAAECKFKASYRNHCNDN